MPSIAHSRGRAPKPFPPLRDWDGQGASALTQRHGSPSDQEASSGRPGSSAMKLTISDLMLLKMMVRFFLVRCRVRLTCGLLLAAPFGRAGHVVRAYT